MREHNAAYGGEMSAHHYFRDFAYCDSGMIPWLLAIVVLSETGKSLSSLVEEMIAKFPCSGEINFKVADTQATIQNFSIIMPISSRRSIRPMGSALILVHGVLMCVHRILNRYCV